MAFASALSAKRTRQHSHGAPPPQVHALKQAWEIDHAEVTLGHRIDEGSEGAFGEVWSGAWGGIDVAVKVLRKGTHLADHACVQDTCLHAHPQG